MIRQQGRGGPNPLEVGRIVEQKQAARNFVGVGRDVVDWPKYVGFFDTIEEGVEYRENMRKIGWRRIPVFHAALKEIHSRKSERVENGATNS
jgi:hypothetical protein